MDLRDTFATNLRWLGHAKGYSQDDLAQDAELDRTYLGRIELGVNYVGLDIICEFACVSYVERAARSSGGRMAPRNERKRLPEGDGAECERAGTYSEMYARPCHEIALRDTPVIPDLKFEASRTNISH